MHLKSKYMYKAGMILCSFILAFSLSSCRRSSVESSENVESASTEVETTEDEYPIGNYDESLSVSNVNESASPYYGVMHVTVLDINGNIGDSSTVYSFKDKKDADNAWSVEGIDIGYIEAEMKTGTDVAILFHGDVIRDGENLEFIAILPDGDYKLKRTEGVTINNTMSAFTINTSLGTQLSFIKDNCRIEDGAMKKDNGDTVVVYYADGGDLGNYPLAVYALL